MGIVWSLIIGGVAGWLAGTIMKGEGYGVLVNILLGIVGGLVGGLVFGLLGIAALLPRKLVPRCVLAMPRGRRGRSRLLRPGVHHPAPATSLPGNSVQPAVLSVALPW